MKIMAYDALEKTFVGQSWKWGASLFSWRFDKIYPATNWADLVGWCCGLGVQIDELQYWGHGFPGAPLIAGVKPPKDLWPKLATVMKPESLVWFRCCAVFNGKAGKDFATYMKDTLKCTVAAHTYNIGFPSHSGLHTAGTQWGDTEGSDPDGKPLMSHPCAPHTIFTLRMNIPKGW